MNKIFEYLAHIAFWAVLIYLAFADVFNTDPNETVIGEFLALVMFGLLSSAQKLAIFVVLVVILIFIAFLIWKKKWRVLVHTIILVVSLPIFLALWSGLLHLFGVV